MLFKAIENKLVQVLGTENHDILLAITQSFVICHELEHLKMCLDVVTDMNETRNTVPGDNSDVDINKGHEKNVHNELGDYDNKSL